MNSVPPPKFHAEGVLFIVCSRKLSPAGQGSDKPVVREPVVGAGIQRSDMAFRVISSPVVRFVRIVVGRHTVEQKVLRLEVETGGDRLGKYGESLSVQVQLRKDFQPWPFIKLKPIVLLRQGRIVESSVFRQSRH